VIATAATFDISDLTTVAQHYWLLAIPIILGVVGLFVGAHTVIWWVRVLLENERGGMRSFDGSSF
jgi:hypothetical protein